MQPSKVQETFYYHEFEVEGQGRFPIDMLRYDRCFPVTEADSRKIYDTKSRQYNKILLGAFAHRGWMPTSFRWKQFGWLVHPA